MATGAIAHGATPDPMSAPGVADDAEASGAQSASSTLGTAIRFWFLRILPLGMCIVGGYALSFYGWSHAWMPTAYVAFVAGIVLAQGFLLPDRDAGLREFFWVSLFFLLTTPLLQFAPIRMDHYSLYAIGNLAGTQVPYMLALLLNLLIASAAGLMFQLLWKWQYSGDSSESSALRRAAWVALPPVISTYAVVVVITNTSVSIQMAVLLPVLGAIFTALLVLRDPTFNPSERDRLFLLSTASVLAMLSTTLGGIAILSIYLAPDLPSVLPDHNLLRSWGNRLRRVGSYQRRGAGPDELGIYVARDMGLHLHVLCCRRQVDRRHIPNRLRPRLYTKVTELRRVDRPGSTAS